VARAWHGGAGAYAELMRAALSLLADACCVLVFVVIGRASHNDGETLAGIASTAWPFLAGLACGEVAARAWRQPLALVPAGVGAWLGAVLVGQALRVLAGQGTALAFVVVSLLFLGVFVLGWRLAAGWAAVRASGRA
jgi:Protein of unknown function (DUF3054)